MIQLKKIFHSFAALTHEIIFNTLREFCISAQPCNILYIIKKNQFNPFAPGDFAEKPVLKQVKWFSGHCCAIKSQHLPQSPLQVVHFMTFWSRWKISTCKVRACTESKILRCTSLDVYFSLSLLPTFLIFLFSKLHFGGKSFEESF